MGWWTVAVTREPEMGSDLPSRERVLLASEGRKFNDEVIRAAAEMTRAHGGSVRVLTIARLWGTGLGLPHPGLRPSTTEMAVHEAEVAHAIGQLESLGVQASGHIVTTRKPGRSILREADRQGCEAIVMGADPRRAWMVRDFMWSQEPYRVRRRAAVPTYLIL